jgi:hypothetical protein
MSKQTAVEKFIEQLEEQGESWENVSIGRIQISIKVEDYLDLIKQTKEKEKQQIVNAYLDGTLQFDNAAEIVRPKEPAVYYTETYGGDK